MVREKVKKDLTAERLRDRKNGKGRCTKEVQEQRKEMKKRWSEKDGRKKEEGGGLYEEI